MTVLPLIVGSKKARAAWVVCVSPSRVLLGGLLIVMIAALSAGCRQSTPDARRQVGHLATVKATEAVLFGEPLGSVAHWLKLLAAADVVYIAVGVLTFDVVLEG